MHSNYARNKHFYHTVFLKKSYKFRFTVIYNRDKSLLAKPHREDKSNYEDGLVLILQGPLFSPMLIDTKAAI